MASSASPRHSPASGGSLISPQTRRGAHPKDARCFSHGEQPRLARATEELSWLLGRGYAPRAALKLVGDRHQLIDRQRRAVGRCAASPQAVARRRAKERDTAELSGERLYIDGYNVLLTIETAISGGVLLLGKDGLLRDLSALSRHYRQLGVTLPALELIGEALQCWSVGEVCWIFDRPISNSGRLCARVNELAESNAWPWSARLDANPDRELSTCQHVVASADSAILDACAQWVNLAHALVQALVPDAWILDLGQVPEDPPTSAGALPP